MASKLLLSNHYYLKHKPPKPPSFLKHHPIHGISSFIHHQTPPTNARRARRQLPVVAVSAAMQPLDLTEENIEKVLEDSRVELAQLFDTSVGMTGVAELAELDGPFVKIRLRGKFWHMRSTVLARLGNYLKQRIPEILEVDIEDEKQLDDSPENF
ncbi:unnamed protein product [Amaranthus hypochondriacus]